jgi:hypothetical protein
MAPCFRAESAILQYLTSCVNRTDDYLVPLGALSVPLCRLLIGVWRCDRHHRHSHRGPRLNIHVTADAIGKGRFWQLQRWRSRRSHFQTTIWNWGWFRLSLGSWPAYNSCLSPLVKQRVSWRLGFPIRLWRGRIILVDIGIRQDIPDIFHITREAGLKRLS